MSCFGYDGSHRDMLHLLNRYKETISDGPGLRYAIYLAGCSHHCPGCHNPESHNPLGGIELSEVVLQGIIQEINNNPMLDGITLSGGDPFFYPEELLALVKRLKEACHLPILCYTGYTYEELLQDERRRPVLQYIDTLIDGRFVLELRDPSLLFRGSRNQRIIDLRNT